MNNKNRTKIMQQTINILADMLCISAITAPKAKGINNIVVRKIDDNEKKLLIEQMKKIADEKAHKGFIRDAKCLEKADAVILIGTKLGRIGLMVCGLCGAQNCADAEANGKMCVYNSGDLGIAIGSLVSKASDFRLDNRIMHSAGYASRELKMLGEDVKIVFAIPLSVSGKNVFFDRE
jgi:uncharacterized ferredoxin-like protein